MIKSIRHRGLRRFFERSDVSRVNPNHVKRLRRILTALHAATRVEDMALTGYYLHPLRGDLQGFWSVRVSGNWRVIFRFEDGDAYDVDYVNYH